MAAMSEAAIGLWAGQAIESDRAEWPERLSGTQGQLLIWGGEGRDVEPLTSVIERLNRPTVLLTLTDADVVLPPFVTHVVCAPVAPTLASSGPHAGRETLRRTFRFLINELRPEGLLIPWQASSTPPLLAAAATEAGCPWVAWEMTSGTLPTWLSGLVPTIPQAAEAADVVRAIREALPQTYLRTEEHPSLNIGCGKNAEQGWLNVDIDPEASAVYMDATQPFPFADDSFDYVFSEHLFEHLDYASGRRMLAEVFRVLRPGGVFRLTTPDFRFLHRLYEKPDRPLHQSYMAWSLSAYSPEIAADFPDEKEAAALVISRFMHLWGHCMIYDRTSLSHLLRRAGFEELAYPVPGESVHPRLAGMERHGQVIPPWANRLESMTVEARKPQIATTHEDATP